MKKKTSSTILVICLGVLISISIIIYLTDNSGNDIISVYDESGYGISDTSRGKRMEAYLQARSNSLLEKVSIDDQGNITISDILNTNETALICELLKNDGFVSFVINCEIELDFIGELGNIQILYINNLSPFTLDLSFLSALKNRSLKLVNVTNKDLESIPVNNTVRVLFVVYKSDEESDLGFIGNLANLQELRIIGTNRFNFASLNTDSIPRKLQSLSLDSSNSMDDVEKLANTLWFGEAIDIFPPGSPRAQDLYLLKNREIDAGK